MDREIDIRRIEVVDERIAERLRAMTPGQRLAKGLDAWGFTRRMIEAGVRHAHPRWTDDLVHAEVRRRMSRAAG